MQSKVSETPLPEKTEAEPLDLRLDEDGRLWSFGEAGRQLVKAHLCFPWTDPNHFISLRSEKDEELALIEDPATLNEASQAALEQAMVQARFVLEIEKIEAVEEEFELRAWRVVTRQGPRRFQTKLDDWPRPVPGGGFIIRDVAGDLFYIATPDRLDEKSRALLWAFVD